MSKSSQQEVIHEGWLTKSPPTTRIWRARWRRRWFTLRQSGELPGQYFLEYYTDRNCRKLKGTIDLDQCEQVDAGLRFEQRKLKFPFMFDIRTPNRIYYLAAESEADMKSWVDCICNVCGLKASNDDVDIEADNDNFDLSMSAAHSVGPDSSLSDIVVGDTPPVSPVSTSPYIPISECITGHARFDPRIIEYNRNASSFVINDHVSLDGHSRQNSLDPNTVIVHGLYDPRFYDSPRQLQPPPTVANRRVPQPPETYTNVTIANNNASPLQSPTDSENVFTDESLTLDRGVNDYNPDNLDKLTNKLSIDEAPPRPPKPSHLGPAPNYFNLPNNTSTLPKETKETNNKDQQDVTAAAESSTSATTSPSNVDFGNETYDFPRSHQIDGVVGSSAESGTGSLVHRKHCYNNAAPSFVNGQAFQYDSSPVAAKNQQQQQGQIFKYDPDDIAAIQASPNSHGSHTSNLPSPQLLTSEAQVLMPPPVVHRNLKPKRKLSDSPSVTSQEPQSPYLAPSVDRTLKPHKMKMDSLTDGHDGFSTGKVNRKQRAAPSPTPPGTNRSQDNLLFDTEQVTLYDNALLSCSMSSMRPRRDQDLTVLQYLDLDLDKDNKDLSGSMVSASNSTLSSNLNLQPPKEVLTVYKTVDFVKTEAIKRTRQHVEEERKLCNKDS